jgi:hypothetical protein
VLGYFLKILEIFRNKKATRHLANVFAEVPSWLLWVALGGGKLSLPQALLFISCLSLPHRNAMNRGYVHPCRKFCFYIMS